MTWKAIKLGDLFVPQKQTVDPADFPKEMFELYSVPAYDTKTPELLSGNRIGSAKQSVAPHDVLLCRIVPHIRRAWVVGCRNGNRMIASSEWIILRNKQVYPDYLKHFLLSNSFHSQFMLTVAGVGGSLLRARPSAAAEIDIPMPPLKEQRRIAAILDKADALRQKRRLALQKLDSLTQSIFLEMFDEHLRSDSGTFVPLQNIAEIVSGITKGRPLRGQSAEPVPYLRVANVQAGYLDLAEIKEIEATEDEITRWNLQSGDVVMTEGGDFDKLGRGAVWHGEIKVCIHQNHVFRVRLNQRKLLPDVFHYFLLTQLARNYFLKCAKQTSNLASINMAQLKSLPVFIPPLSLQAKFVKALDRKLSVTRVQNSARKDSCAVFESLQHRAFRGEL